MPSASASSRADHPALWRADALARPGAAVLSSTYPALDAELPGGGWPAAGLVELLQPRRPLGACHEWRLLLPALASLVEGGQGTLALVGAPDALVPFVPTLAVQGLPPARLLWVQAEAARERLWATEQALRCADVPAVLAWLPQVRVELLRRLHLAAVEHGKPLFAFRPAAAQRQASPSPLRLLLDGSDALQVQVFKRRGPPMAAPIVLAAHAPPLAALARRRTLRPPPADTTARPPHVLDRTVAA